VVVVHCASVSKLSIELAVVLGGVEELRECGGKGDTITAVLAFWLGRVKSAVRTSKAGILIRN